MKSGHRLIEDNQGRNAGQNSYLAVSESDAPSSKMGISLGRWRFVTGFWGGFQVPHGSCVSFTGARAKKSSFRGWWRCPQCLVTRNAENRKIDMRRSKSSEQWQTIHMLPQNLGLVSIAFPFAATFFGLSKGDYPLTSARPRSSTGRSGMVVGAIGAESSPRLRGSWEILPWSWHLQFDLAVSVKITCQRNVIGYIFHSENLTHWLYIHIYVWIWIFQNWLQFYWRGHRSILYVWQESFQATEWSPRNRNWMKVEIDVDEVLQFPATQNPQP